MQDKSFFISALVSQIFKKYQNLSTAVVLWALTMSGGFHKGSLKPQPLNPATALEFRGLGFRVPYNL